MLIKDPSRLAWTVLISALVVFCIMATAIFLGVRWFLFESTTPMLITLSVGKDTVVIQTSTGEGAERASRSLSRDVKLTTDSSSQGYVTFSDPYTHEVVASLTLLRDSTIVVGDAARPRFDFSTRPYMISISNLSGNADVDIVPELGRGILFDIHSDSGFIRLDSTGLYALTGGSDSVSVFNRAGEAVVVNQELQSRSVPAGMQGSLSAADGLITLSVPMINILPDGRFDTFNPANNELSSAWGCYTQRDDPASPPGEYRREVVNGRTVMHIVRTSQGDRSARNHAQTGCLQYLNTVSTPLPVTTFNYLEIRATLMIRWLPDMLNVCGQRGSECPVMVVMKYIDSTGATRSWIHGFYSRYEQSVGWPLRCDTCAQDHERLNQDTWFTYTSGNLLQLLPEDQRPVAVSSVEFYASGHEYEVLISEIALMAGTVPQAEESVPEGTQG